MIIIMTLDDPDLFHGKLKMHVSTMHLNGKTV